jgi:hypothetical protein
MTTSSTRRLKDEEGSALVLALLMIVLLTLMGIAVTKQSAVELQIAGNYKVHKTAFHHADSGTYATPKLIAACIQADQDLGGMTYLGGANTFYREIMGFDAYDPARDVRYTMSGFNIDVDVNRVGARNIAGGGVEFASGAEGIGVGSGGGVAILYDVDSLGNGPAGSRSIIVSGYRLVVGVIGGL